MENKYSVYITMYKDKHAKLRHLPPSAGGIELPYVPLEGTRLVLPDSWYDNLSSDQSKITVLKGCDLVRRVSMLPYSADPDETRLVTLIELL